MALIIKTEDGKRRSSRAGHAAADPRWSAVLRRDRTADGAFVFAVKTTGIYCRPSCPARRAKADNVVFYASCAEAEQAGFRACRRCRPNAVAPAQIQAALVARACRRIEAAQTAPTLAALAAEAGLSPFHFHRLFKAVTGLTPHAYGAGQRAARVRKTLDDKTGSITAALYDAGYNSSGRFYESSNQVLGMTPTSYRAGGAQAAIKFALGRCSLGTVLVARSDKGVCAILLGDDADALLRDLQDRFPQADLIGGDADFESWVATIVGFVDDPGRGLDLPLDIRGTAFQERVWQALRAIPPGETRSYTQVAQRIGAPKAVRAVASACAANPLAVAVPCHRVVRTDGALSGYRWGLARKQALLDKEAETKARVRDPAGKARAGS